jgi:ABC-2 type transport system ATP-binding protein
MSDVVLNTIDLVKKYRGKAALVNVCLEIKKGQIYGLIGNNGAGKTTLIRVVCGIAPPTSGEIELFGSKTELASARKRMGVVLDNPGILSNLNAYENMVAQCILTKANKNKISEILDIVGLEDMKGKKAKTFSLGMKRRLSIGMALVNNPEFLVLDEPTNGLDPSGINDMRKILKLMVKEKGVTILISSHILAELSNLATDYGVLNNGELIKQFSSDELNKIVTDRKTTLENYFLSLIDATRKKEVR